MSYNEHQNYFLMFLKKLALQMKDIEKKDRMDRLKEKIHSLNKWIDKEVRGFEFKGETSMKYKVQF